MSLTLTASQQDAIDAAIGVVQNSDSQGLFLVTGPAGTGKSATIGGVIEALEDLGLDGQLDEPVIVAVPTNSSRRVLESKGISNPRTFHSLIKVRQPIPPLKDMLSELENSEGDPIEIVLSYEKALGIEGNCVGEVARYVNRIAQRSRMGAKSIDVNALLYKLKVTRKTINANHIFAPKPIPDEPCGICIADEISMVGMSMIEEALLHYRVVIGFGDVNQLKPVKDASPFDGRAPIACLTEILRSNRTVCDYADKILKGKPLVRVIPEVDGQVNLSDILAGNAIAVTAQNACRILLNNRARKALFGYDTEIAPQVGELVIVKANDYKQDRYCNNMVCKVIDSSAQDWDDEVKLTLRPLEHCEEEISAYDFSITAFDSDYSPYQPPKSVPIRFGYCVTAHIAQGSEYAKVYVNGDDISRFDTLNWTYTAVTRAKEQASWFSISQFGVK